MKKYSMQSKSESKRKERKEKLKRVLNYEPEMNFLKSFYKLRGKEMPLEDFIELTKKTLVDTNQVSEAVFEFFVDELRINEQIKLKSERINEIESEKSKLQSEIDDLQKSLDEDSDEDDSVDLQTYIKKIYNNYPTLSKNNSGYSDPCGRTSSQSRGGC